MIDLNTRRFVLESDQDGINTLHGLNNLIKENVKKDFIICEIGSYMGVSSELFAENCKQLYCVDPWIPYWDGIAGGVTDLNKIKIAEEQFDNRMSKFNNVIKLKKKVKKLILCLIIIFLI